NWGENDKVYQFTKGLKRELASQIRPHLVFQNNPTLDRVIEVSRQIEENSQTFPETVVGFYNQPTQYNYGPGMSNNNNNYLQPSYPQQNYIEGAVAKALSPLLQALGNLSLGQPVQQPIQNPVPVDNNNNYNNNRGFRNNNNN